VEVRANKLMEAVAININTEVTEIGEEGTKGADGKEVGSMSATTEDDDEIDWDQIQNSLDNNLEVDILSVKKARTQPPCVGVQGTRGTKCTSRKKSGSSQEEKQQTYRYTPFFNCTKLN
jgi:hypothetical protein